MMLLSIFILLKGTNSNRCNDEYPLPKSSMANIYPRFFQVEQFFNCIRKIIGQHTFCNFQLNIFRIHLAFLISCKTLEIKSSLWNCTTDRFTEAKRKKALLKQACYALGLLVLAPRAPHHESIPFARVWG